MHVAHPGTSHDNTKPCMMRLIINASLKQVNLVWSSQCAQCSCSSKLSWESVISILSISLQGPYTVLDWWGRFHFLYGSRDAGAQHTFTSPYPMPFTCITLLWIRGPRYCFFSPPPTSLLSRKIRFLQSFQHQTQNLGPF